MSTKKKPKKKNLLPSRATKFQKALAAVLHSDPCTEGRNLLVELRDGTTSLDEVLAEAEDGSNGDINSFLHWLVHQDQWHRLTMYTDKQAVLVVRQYQEIHNTRRLMYIPHKRDAAQWDIFSQASNMLGGLLRDVYLIVKHNGCCAGYWATSPYNRKFLRALRLSGVCLPINFCGIGSSIFEDLPRTTQRYLLAELKSLTHKNP